MRKAFQQLPKKSQPDVILRSNNLRVEPNAINSTLAERHICRDWFHQTGIGEASREAGAQQGGGNLFKIKFIAPGVQNRMHKKQKTATSPTLKEL